MGVEASEKRSTEVREKYQKEMVHDKADTKDVYRDIVKQNRERLERADECAKEQTLQQIMTTNNRIDTMLSARQKKIDYRLAGFKEIMKGKTQVEELKRVMQDSSTKRINQMLQELGMPLLQPPTAKEGDDEQKNQ